MLDLFCFGVVVFFVNIHMFSGVNDGSTEAAMTLLAMSDPVFQLNISTQGMMYNLAS